MCLLPWPRMFALVAPQTSSPTHNTTIASEMISNTCIDEVCNEARSGSAQQRACHGVEVQLRAVVTKLPG